MFTKYDGVHTSNSLETKFKHRHIFYQHPDECQALVNMTKSNLGLFHTIYHGSQNGNQHSNVLHPLPNRIEQIKFWAIY